MPIPHSCRKPGSGCPPDYILVRLFCVLQLYFCLFDYLTMDIARIFLYVKILSCSNANEDDHQFFFHFPRQSVLIQVKTNSLCHMYPHNHTPHNVIDQHCCHKHKHQAQSEWACCVLVSELLALHNDTRDLSAFPVRASKLACETTCAQWLNVSLLPKPQLQPGV